MVSPSWFIEVAISKNTVLSQRVFVVQKRFCSRFYLACMKTLIKFFLTFKTLLVFLFLELVSFLLIVNNNQFQKSQFLSSSNVIVGSIYEGASSVFGYFGLKETNGILAQENSRLKEELLSCKSELERMRRDSNFAARASAAERNCYSFVSAKVINASVYKERNYITLDKGAGDGIRQDMGVIGPNGVVGIVRSVSDHFSEVIPIVCLSDFNVSARIKGNSNLGSVSWSGGDYRKADLWEIPQYVSLQVGDTVETSGCSSIFPEGIVIGTVCDVKRKSEDYFYDVEIRLSTDFSNLSYVDVINYQFAEEQNNLEEAEK